MMFAGLEDISDGLLMVAEQPMTGPRDDIGIMFQDPTLLPWKTALENVLFPVAHRPHADRAGAPARYSSAAFRRPASL